MPGREKIDAVQILRAAAALGVVLVHAGISLNYWGHLNVTWTVRGNSGVDLFFLISGFVVVFIAFADRDKPPNSATFLLRRAVRIIPLYWLITTIYLVSNSYPAGRVAGSYMFLPLNLPPVLPVGWTLCYEMFFYVLFAACLGFGRRLAVGFLVAGMTIFTVSGIGFYGDPIILEFGLGALIGLAYVEGVALPSALRMVLIAAGFALLASLEPGGQRLIYWGLPSGAILAGAVLGPVPALGRWSAPLVLLGDASYALYLTHMPIVRLVGTAMRDSGIDLAASQAAYIIVAVSASIAVAVIVHRYIEKPITAALRRLTKPTDVSAVSRA